MVKKLIIIGVWFLIMAILGIILCNSDIMSQTEAPVALEEKITAQALKVEMEKEDFKLSPIEAINIVERKLGGKIIALRLRRLRDRKLGYAILVFDPKEASLKSTVVHGTTGEIGTTVEIETYTISHPLSQHSH